MDDVTGLFNVWKKQVDSFRAFCSQNRRELMALNIAKEPCNFHIDSLTPFSIDFKIPNNIKACFDEYPSLKMFEWPSSLATLFENPIDELTSIPWIDNEEIIVNRIYHEIEFETVSFDRIILNGNKIIAHLSAGNFNFLNLIILINFSFFWQTENKSFIEQNIEKLNEEWTDLIKLVEKLKNFTEIMQNLNEKFIEKLKLKDILDNYTEQFRQYYEKSIHEDINIDASKDLLYEIDLCQEQTLEFHKDELILNESTLYNIYLQMPFLFICWPEPLTTKTTFDQTKSVAKFDWFKWKHINQDSPLFADINKSISQNSAQKYAIGYFGFLLNFDRNIIFLLQIVELIKIHFNSLNAIQNLRMEYLNEPINFNENLIENNRIKQLQSSANWELNQQVISYDKIEMAIKKFSNWLSSAINIIDEYNDENLLEKNSPELFETKKNELYNINNLSDITKYFDKQKSDIKCIKDMVLGEQSDYRFFCKRIAYIVFEEEEVEEEDSSNIKYNEEYYYKLEEKIISYFKNGQFLNYAHINLICINNLIFNWRLAIEKIENIVAIFDYKSEIVLTLEADCGLLNKLKETGDFSKEKSIALGDLDTLNVQLEDCKKFREHVEYSAKNYIKNIIDNIQKILISSDENIPVIKDIKNFETKIIRPIDEFYQCLLNGLDLTKELMDSINEFEIELNNIEKQIMSYEHIEDFIQNFQNSNELSKNKLTNIYENMFTELEFSKKRFDSKISNILNKIELFPNQNRTLALENLKNMAEKNLPDRYNLLMKELTSNFNYFIEKIIEIDKLMETEKQFLENITKYHHSLELKQANIQDLENAVQAIDEVDDFIQEYNDHEQNV